MQWSSGGWLLSEKAISDAAKQQCNIAAQLSLLAYDFTYLFFRTREDLGPNIKVRFSILRLDLADEEWRP